MKTMHIIVSWSTGIAAVLHANSTYANDEVLGYWASEGSIIHITQAGELLSARVFALKEPTYVEGEKFGPVGAVRRDDLNPQASERSKRIIGLELLSQYRHTGKRWEGKIYDPESGNTYSSRMAVNSDSQLQMRGYIGVPLLGRTAIFHAIATCTQAMQEMLRRSAKVAPQCAVTSAP